MYRSLPEDGRCLECGAWFCVGKLFGVIMTSYLIKCRCVSVIDEEEAHFDVDVDRISRLDEAEGRCCIPSHAE